MPLLAVIVCFGGRGATTARGREPSDRRWSQFAEADIQGLFDYLSSRMVLRPLTSSACPPQMQSPAISSQGFHRSATCRGLTRDDRSRVLRVPRLGMILRPRLEGGRCPFASGAPATGGAHNSETLMRQPDHQLLVQESVPGRIAEALLVDAFRRSLSRRSAYRIGMSATSCLAI